MPSEGILSLAASTTWPMGGHRLRIEATGRYFSDTGENVFQGGLKLLENVDDAAWELGVYGVASSVGGDEHAVRIEGLFRDPTFLGSDALSAFTVGGAYLGTDRERLQGLANINWKLPPVDTHLRLTGLAERVPTGESAVLGGEVGTQFPVTKDPLELSAGVFANGQYSSRSGQVDANFGVGAQFGVQIDPNTDLQLRLDPFSGATLTLSHGF